MLKARLLHCGGLGNRRIQPLFRGLAARLSPLVAMALVFCGLATAALAQPAAAPAKAQASVEPLRLSLRAADVVAVKEFFDPAGAARDSFDVVCRAVFRRPASLGSRVAAFEEQRFFTYALGETVLPGASRAGAPADGPSRLLRRFILLKPSTFVIDDQVLGPSSAAARWALCLQARPEISAGQIRATEGASEILCRTLLPEKASYQVLSGQKAAPHRVELAPQGAAGQTRFLHVVDVRRPGAKASAAQAELTRSDGAIHLTVRTPERTFRLRLPEETAEAGDIAVSKADGQNLLERRVLPSGVLPHDAGGPALLERWDSAYRGGRRAAWDTGRPSSDLKKAVEGGTLRPCRVVELGCGTGTNAVYLAGKGFDVTAIDIAPTAIGLAQEKARKAAAKVRWLLADVLDPPKLEPFDLIYDRGCYHGVRRGNAAGYVEAVRRLSHPGTRLLILAGNANETARGGPPRVKEEELRADFSGLFEFEWLRETRFDTFDPAGKGAVAWSILLRRKAE